MDYQLVDKILNYFLPVTKSQPLRIAKTSFNRASESWQGTICLQVMVTQLIE